MKTEKVPVALAIQNLNFLDKQLRKLLVPYLWITFSTITKLDR